MKSFGTRDLRHANLPDRDDVLLSPPTSPTRGQTFLPSSTHEALPSPPTSPNRAQTFLSSATRSPPTTAPPLPARKTPTGGPFDPARATSPPLLKPTRNYSPARTPAAESAPNGETTPPQSKDSEDWDPPTVPSHNGRSATGLPRTVPLDPAMVGPARPTSPTKSPTKSPPTPPRPLPATLGRMAVPLSSTPTGTRYGAALGGRTASPMAPMATGRQWGGGTPSCGKCGKTVYFAEQVRAIGKTYHRSCLRCTECNTTLDSSRLTENEGNPYCKNCYGKVSRFACCFDTLLTVANSCMVPRATDMPCSGRQVAKKTLLTSKRANVYHVPYDSDDYLVSMPCLMLCYGPL